MNRDSFSVLSADIIEYEKMKNWKGNMKQNWSSHGFHHILNKMRWAHVDQNDPRAYHRPFLLFARISPVLLCVKLMVVI